MGAAGEEGEGEAQAQGQGGSAHVRSPRGSWGQIPEGRPSRHSPGLDAPHSEIVTVGRQSRCAPSGAKPPPGRPCRLALGGMECQQIRRRSRIDGNLPVPTRGT